MQILYLRTDFWFDLRAGGSVGHVAGVIRGFTRLGHGVRVWSSDTLCGVDPPLVQVIRPWRLLRLPGLRVLGPLVYNLQVLAASRRFDGARPDVIYHRYGDFSCAGALVARRMERPLILEVNNLFAPWAKEQNNHWLMRLGFLGRKVERYSLRTARLVVAVSDVVRDQVREAGVPDDRILVNPNGVDVEAFHPGIDGTDVRRRLGVNGERVVGFIGTFSSWHGVEELSRAIPEAVRRRPNLCFLLIGDGPLRSQLEKAVQSEHVGHRVFFVGTVSHDDAPRYLAACDFFVSPHGRPRSSHFIGSPTKVFEYMAMGRGIVASDLDQLGRVLTHGETAILVEPGNADALAEAILYLSDHPSEASRLGMNARRVVSERYTWEENVRRLLAASEGCL